MKIFIGLISLILFLTCKSKPDTVNIAIHSNKPKIDTFSTTDQILKYTLKLDSVKINRGDTLEIVMGNLFADSSKHLIIASTNSSQETSYKVYKFENKYWKQILFVNAPYQLIQYSLVDYDFDGRKDRL